MLYFTCIFHSHIIKFNQIDFPRPTTRQSCETSCEFFYKLLADDLDQKSNHDPATDVLDFTDATLINPPCTAKYIKMKLGRQLPQASLPKNAAQAGCREAKFVFTKCLKRYLAKQKKASNLRGGSEEESTGGGHISKLEQLKNWKKMAAAGGGDDPLL